jgi:glycosyltransferase involved in cell wall biosynthesis
MKVLFVYKFLTLGGCETVLRARLDGLPAHGIDARAWFLHDGAGRALFRGVEHRVDVGSVQAAHAAIARGDYDVVSTLDTEEILPTFRAGEVAARLFVEVHSPYLENLEYLRTLRGLPVCRYLVPSRFQAGIVRERVGDAATIRVCPNPLRSEFAAPLIDFPAPPRRPVVVWIGRFDRLKNWQEMVEVARRLVARGSAAEIWMVGRPPEGEAAAPFVDTVRRAGILPRLRWYRGLSHDRVAVLLDAVRASGGVLVSTSRGDSFGMTVAEALVRACAVVVPRYGPFPEFVDDSCGLFYAPGDADDAARQIDSLIKDGERRTRLGLAGREQVLARYGPAPALAALSDELRSVTVSAQRTAAS